MQLVILRRRIGEDEDDYANELEDDHEQCNEDDEAISDIVTTPMGKLHVKTAEAIYLNGEKSKFNTKSRKAIFFVNCFYEKSDLKSYNSQNISCFGPAQVL